MKKKVLGILIFIMFITNILAFADSALTEEERYIAEAKRDVLCLMMSYPDYVKGAELGADGTIYIVTAKGTKILYDDKKSKGFEELMDNADIQDILSQKYPLGTIDKLEPLESDPGRFRCYKLLNEVYGESQSEVTKNLTAVPAPYNTYQFNSHNGAAESLKAAMNELKEISKSNGKVSQLINPINGTFNYRLISGTGKLSPHAYGIAIDINSNPNDYWKWASREGGEKRMLQYPKELIDTFEKYNFVWGGKWGHFDILHFEYRPEIIAKARYFSEDVKSAEKWFEGVEESEENKLLIQQIDEVFSKSTGTVFNENKPEEVDDEVKSEIKDFIEKTISARNRAIITGEREGIKAVYDMSTKFGQWAYESEEKKMIYLHNWEQKQGVRITEIDPMVVITRISEKDGGGFKVNCTCSTEYRYVYEDEPEIVNASRIGTYHVIGLINKDGRYLINKEWYTDPFADSLNLDKLNVDDVKQYIMAQKARDFTNLDERRIKAKEYADRYCGAATEEEYGFKYNKDYRNFNSEGGDCANFASQILSEGGGFKKNYTWNYRAGDATASWVNADKFKDYWIYSGRASVIAYGTYEKVYKESYKLEPGDFVAYERKGDVKHISMVTNADSRGYALVTCHNTDRNDVPWDLGWSDKNIKFWLVKVHF